MSEESIIPAVDAVLDAIEKLTSEELCALGEALSWEKRPAPFPGHAVVPMLQLDAPVDYIRLLFKLLGIMGKHLSRPKNQKKIEAVKKSYELEQSSVLKLRAIARQVGLKSSQELSNLRHRYKKEAPPPPDYIPQHRRKKR